MSTKIIATIFTSLLTLSILLGTQLHQTTMHFMDGQLTTEHEMPLNDCGGASCVMLPGSVSTLQLSHIKNIEIESIFLVKAFLLIFLLLITTFYRYKHQLILLITGPPDFKMSSVILRE